MWEKKGLIFSFDKYGTGYAQDPFIDMVSDDVWRVYFSARTQDVVSLPFCVDVEANNPSNVLKVYEEPLFLPGQSGTFDDTGITMTSIVNVGKEKYIYYCGWNKKVTVSYSLSIGLAIVREDGRVEKMYEGPILERSIHDPIAVSAPCVIYDEGIFKLWYITFTSWKEYDGRKEPTFVIKYATSNDGIKWETNTDICIDSTYEGESFARPWVIKDKGIYKMWFSSRGPEGYRETDGQHYELDYAESLDGKTWERKTDKFKLVGESDGWDAGMTAYATVVKGKDNYFMLYNGNDFGKTGFGYATSKDCE
ncbi:MULTISPECIES: hypothetical protein [Vibrio]|uniref:hypothetical protein n=1 Tax=Vibrio TaxID=662 RepID=UPI00097E2532|nr:MULTISPECIES: hypothetical protein [Vibrio]AQM18530.1 hypothetical protein PN51_01655 [Vibrio anguillarum]AQP34964.1 hypothetical protein AA909_00980 [Vibrio anguillarum]AUB87033.1 hypothetical protein CKY00_06725 [Vibrio anguillarum]AUB90473.1 hypothetical protein CKX99_06735 [Vibrio anguillarum]AUB93911.1 hypothetical protein CK210_06730 [Vibrio anguillarum]